MKVHQCNDYLEVSKTAADWFLQRVRKNPASKIGIATGNSTLGMYRYIAKTQNQYTKSLSLFQLDEWVGLSEQQHSGKSSIEKEVRIPWGISVERTHYFSHDVTLLTSANQAAAAAAAMQQALDEKGPLDILILGMGKNGHLGFVEPGEHWPADACYVSDLALTTQKHHMIALEQTPPKIGVTMGIKSILEAKEILFIVTGGGKTTAYDEWLKKVITPKLPATILWKHPNVTLVTDL